MSNNSLSFSTSNILIDDAHDDEGDASDDEVEEENVPYGYQ